MSNQTFVNIKSNVYKTLKKAVLKKFDKVFKMNNKRKNFILLRILDNIQQDNEDARDSIDKSTATISNEEGISIEQVFYILFFDAVFISNKSSFSF